MNQIESTPPKSQTSILQLGSIQKGSVRLMSKIGASFLKRVETMNIDDAPVMGFQNAQGEAIDISVLSDPSM